ncbi:MAG: nuclear transport factor 2 family protein [Egibacteraceae bacterium]
MEPLAREEVNRFVDDWYRNLDVHAPAKNMLALLAEDGLEIHFPEGTFRGRDEFRRLYDGWVRFYFDEVHELKEFSTTPAGETSEVKLVVNWKFRIWNPPAAKSRLLEYDAYQTWVVQRSPASGQPVMVTYIVEALQPHNGSPPFGELLAQ